MKIFNQGVLWSAIMLPAISFLLLPQLATAIAKAQLEKTKMMANALHNRAKLAVDLAKHRRYATTPHLLQNNNIGHNLLNLRPRRKIEKQANPENISINQRTTPDVIGTDNGFKLQEKTLVEKNPQRLMFSWVQSNDENDTKEPTYNKRAPQIKQDDSNFQTIWDMNRLGSSKQNINVVRQAPAESGEQHKFHRHLSNSGETVGCITGDRDYPNPYGYFQRATEDLDSINQRITPGLNNFNNDLQLNISPEIKVTLPIDNNANKSNPQSMQPNLKSIEPKVASPSPDPTLNSGFSHSHTTTHFVNVNNKPSHITIPTGSEQPQQYGSANLNNGQLVHIQGSAPSKPYVTITLPYSYLNLPTGNNPLLNTNIHSSTQSFLQPGVTAIAPSTQIQPGYQNELNTQALYLNQAAASAQSSSINGNGNIVLQKRVSDQSSNGNIGEFGAFQWIPNRNIGNTRLKRQISKEKSISDIRIPNNFSSYYDPCSYKEKLKMNTANSSSTSPNQLEFMEKNLDEGFLGMRQKQQENERENALIENSPNEQLPATNNPKISPLNLAKDIIETVDKSVPNQHNLISGLLGIEREHLRDDNEDNGRNIDEDIARVTKEKPFENMPSHDIADLKSNLHNEMLNANIVDMPNGEISQLDSMGGKNIMVSSRLDSAANPEANHALVDKTHYDSTVSLFELNHMSQQEHKAYHVLLQSEIPPGIAYKTLQYIHKINEAVESTPHPDKNSKNTIMRSEHLKMDGDEKENKIESIPKINSNPKWPSITIPFKEAKKVGEVNMLRDNLRPTTEKYAKPEEIQTETLDIKSISPDIATVMPESLEEEQIKKKENNDSIIEKSSVEATTLTSTVTSRINDEISRQIPLVDFDSRHNMVDKLFGVEKNHAETSEVTVGLHQNNIEDEEAAVAEVTAMKGEERKDFGVHINNDENKDLTQGTHSDSIMSEATDKIDSSDGSTEYTKSQLRRAMQFIIDLDKDVKALPLEQKERFIRQEMLLISMLMDETALIHDTPKEGQGNEYKMVVASPHLFQAPRRSNLPHYQKKRSVQSKRWEKLYYSILGQKQID